jgi:hypothetical protein
VCCLHGKEHHADFVADQACRAAAGSLLLALVARPKCPQGSLSSADDLALKGFSTIFASSPSLLKEALDMPRDNEAVVVPAWMLPPVDAHDGGCSGSGAGCEADGDGDEVGAAAAFYFDTLATMTHPSSAQSSSRLMSICFANEHAPHPLQQLQPCFDSGADAVVLLRLPLLVVDAVSVALASRAGGAREPAAPGAFRANEEDVVRAEAHCSTASEAAAKNGLYM